MAYVALGGPGLGLSVNYDRRFKKQVDGFGFNAGLGSSLGTGDDFSITTIPLGINCLLGNTTKGRYFEIGIAQTLLFTGSRNNNYWYSTYNLAGNKIGENTTYSYTNFIAGYRSQPSAGGFNFRTGISPIFFRGKNEMNIYLSIGYNF